MMNLKISKEEDNEWKAYFSKYEEMLNNLKKNLFEKRNASQEEKDILLEKIKFLDSEHRKIIYAPNISRKLLIDKWFKIFNITN